MKICIDARSPGKRGILPYTRCLIDGLLRIDQDNEYVIVTDSDHAEWEGRCEQQVIVPSQNPAYWMVWSNTTLAALIRRHAVDVYHSFKHMTLYRSSAKRILTLHGNALMYLHPDFYRWYDLLYWRWSCALAIRTYDRVITVSDAEKRFFTERKGFPASRFSVTNLAADTRFRRIEDRIELARVRDQLGLPEHFLLFVGYIHPVKNVEGLVRAFALARQRGLQHKLVLAGGEFPGYADHIRRLVDELKLAEDVIFAGYVVDDLPALYSLTDLFVFPTRYEAFPQVLLEAMACGAPVVASDVAGVREVIGDAGLLFDPEDDEQIATCILQLLSSEDQRRDLIERGLRRHRQFSWDRCARETLEIYEEVFRQAAPSKLPARE